MPLAKRFKLGLGSCWGNTAAPSAVNPEEEKKEEKKEEEEAKPYDFSKHPEHAVWRLAAAAAATSRHHPTQEDALVPWSHAAAAEGATSHLCTLAPVAAGTGLATLFLRTTLSPVSLAKRLHTDFFDDSNVSVKVSLANTTPAARRFRFPAQAAWQASKPQGVGGARCCRV